MDSPALRSNPRSKATLPSGAEPNEGNTTEHNVRLSAPERVQELCVLRYAHEPHAGCSGRGVNYYLTFLGSEDVSELYNRWMKAWNAGEARYRS